ncbi:MAG TPA: lysophospholipid acyltransferase family protein [Vicinamibacterales bacterium]|nr:lysophospholipid acyltransferase family protein [Vicinamibacterales bacterium]
MSLGGLRLAARSLARWSVGFAFFAAGALLVLAATVVRPPDRTLRLQRWICRTLMRIAGADLILRTPPGYDGRRTGIFVSNHVNLFDPFVLYATIPQIIRGLELESHFRIPFYGWVMKRFGNIPVASTRRPRRLKAAVERMRATLERGYSVVVFPEGTRTRTGRVGPFRDGAFRIAILLGYPIVPVSIVGSYALHRTGDWRLYPAGPIVVQVHEPIETRGLTRRDAGALRDRVREIVRTPVEAALAVQDLDVRTPAHAGARPR